MNVDIDHYEHVVGIEMLSVGPDQLNALAQIVQLHELDISPLFSVAKRLGSA